MAARCLNKIKDLVKAEGMCDDIIAFVKEQGGLGKPYAKFALKAVYMKSKNMLNIMEFRKAKSLLEEEALPILKALQ